MNKKGQSLGISVISMIFVFIIGIMFINFIMPEITTTRGDLNCADGSSISDGTKLLCLVIDTTIPYWIVLILTASVGFVTMRLNL